MDQLERLQRQRKGEAVPPPSKHQFGKGEIGILPNKAKKYFVFIGSDTEEFAGEIVCLPPRLARGISRKIERGKIAPSLEILILLSDRFHKSVDWILRGEGN